MAAADKDYYKLLGVSRDARAEDLSKAYKKLARQHHPDLNPGNKESEEKFKDINEAYEVLKDPEKRKLYDQFGANWEQGQHFQDSGGFQNMNFNFNGADFGGGDYSDIFESIFGKAGGGQGSPFGGAQFGGFGSRPRRGRDAEAELPLTLEEVARGGRRKVTLQMPDGPRTLEVNVPEGIRDGAKLRLAGQGDPGPKGGPAGDLFLIIRYRPHKNFTVDGENLLCEVDVSPWEAVLGARVPVKTLEGEVEMKIPAGSSSGRKFRLRGKGLGKAAKRGDLIATLMIRSPRELSAEEKELWEKLASISTFKARQ